MFEDLFGTTKTVSKPKGKQFQDLFKKKEYTAEETKISYLPDFLGGGAYNSVINQPDVLLKTEAKYGLVPPEIGKEGHHIIPVEFGGSSETDKNMKNLPVEVHAKITEAEGDISRRYKNGEITLGQARQEMMAVLQRELDAAQGIKQGTKENILSGIWEAITNPVESIKKAIKTTPQTTEAVKSVGESITKPIENRDIPLTSTFSDFVKSIQESWDNAVDKVSETAFTSGANSKTVGKYLEAGAGIAGLAFSPITAAFEASKNLPVIGTLASVVNLPLAVAGDSLTNLTTEGLNALVYTGKMSEETAGNIRQGLGEIITLAGQIVVAGNMFKGEKLKEKKAELEKKYGAKDAETILKKAEERANIELKTEKKTELNLDEFKKKYKEEVTPEILRKSEQLGDPVLQVGNNKVAIELPKLNDIQRAKLFDEVANINFKTSPIHVSQKRILKTDAGKGLEVIKLKEAVDRFPEVKKLVEDLRIQRVIPKPIEYKPITEVVEAQPEIKTSKLSLGVEEKAIAKKLSDGFEDLPEYAKVDVKQQAKAASDLLKQNREDAIKIAKGEQLPPEGILPEAVFTAVEEYALKNNDVSLLQDLAQSNLATQATGMGQRLRLLAERVDNSPVGRIKEVIKNRKDYIEEKTGKKVSQLEKAEISKMKEQIKKSKPTKDAWLSFVKEITC